MFNAYLFLFLGFAILIIGGKLLIKGGIELASHLKVSNLVIGITVVAFGTSAPEIFISIIAAYKNSPDIVVSNIIGSNIANITLILGITAIILPIPVHKDVLIKDWVFLLMVSCLLLFSFLDKNFHFWEGLFFLVLLLMYIYLSLRNSRKKLKKNKHKFSPSKYSIYIVIIFIIVSSICLYKGAELLVYNAKIIARDIGISERIIGLTLIALGTSIPELVTSILAALKQKMEISVGNIIGSNIYNIGAALGITAFLNGPIIINPNIVNFDIYFMLAITLLLGILLAKYSTLVLNRYKGGILLLSYIIYILIIFDRV